MPPVARVLIRLPWLVWAWLLLAPLTGSPGPSLTAESNSAGVRAHAITPGNLGDAHHTRSTVRATRHHRVDDGPVNQADTADPAGLRPLALALNSPAPLPAQMSVPVSCTAVGLHAFELVDPLGSRPPPFSS
jgi:hypothetical protein